MRLGLGFVMAWFGAHELHSPGEWTVFVPKFVAGISPIGVNDLIVLHGFFLVLAAAAVLLGVFYVAGSVLAIGLMAEIVFGLWYDGGVSDLVIRDIGLLGLAVALAFDPSRFWHLENVLTASGSLARSERRRAEKAGRMAWGGRTAASVIASGAVLLGFVSGAAMVLYESGNGAASPGSGDLSLAGSTATPAPATAAPAGQSPAASATPAPSGNVTSTQFDSWRYKQYAYQIYPGTLSSDAQKAISGFQLNIQDQGGSVVLQLKATSSRYTDATYTVDKANSAYFIETSFRDDPNDQEQDLDDDGVVVVNQQGYILKS
jgi:hypothetical protein